MKKKRIIAVAALAGIVTLVGGTVAYFSSSSSFDNQFNLASGNVEYVETFESPSNWKSCDETPKTLVITNKSDQPVYARFKMTEYWKARNSTSTGQTSDLSFYYDGARVAIINLQNENDWEKQGDWYVYKQALQKNESTSSLLKSVTFNCEPNFAKGVDYTEDGKSGTTSANEYEAAKYHLDLTAQTVITSQRAEAWGE
jgi:alternate signal-mediated exported protein